jgi:dGTP triphosphohydrolase
MIGGLHEVYQNASQSRPDWKIFPAYYQEQLAKAQNEDERSRTCIDLIAGMTETQVHRLYARITGISSEGSLNNPLN